MAKSRAIGFLISAIFHAFLITLIISTQFTVHWTQPENQDREVKLVVPIQNTGSNKILIPGFSALKSGDNIPVVAVPDSNRILKNDTGFSEQDEHDTIPDSNSSLKPNLSFSMNLPDQQHLSSPSTLFKPTPLSETRFLNTIQTNSPPGFPYFFDAILLHGKVPISLYTHEILFNRGQNSKAFAIRQNRKHQVALSLWSETVLNRINSAWIIPPRAVRGENDEVGVKVVVAANGSVVSSWIEDSSSEESYNQAALDAITACHAFPPLPVGLMDKQITIYFLFSYNE
jgi:TonB family protein